MSKEITTVNTELISTLAAINERLNAMKMAELTGFKSHGKFRWNPAYTGNAPIDIHTNTDLSELLNIYASLSRKQDDYNTAAEQNGLSEYPVFKWQDSSGDDWLHDIKLRINMLTHETKKRELLNAKKELSTFMSPEDKLAITIANVSNLLK